MQNRLKTHCPAGHEYTPENTAVDRRGCRSCRECHRARTLADYYRNKGRDKSLESVLKHRARSKASEERRRRLDPVSYYAAMERKSQVRQARKRGASAAEYIDRKLVFARDAGICGICGEPADPDDFHVDHIIALARGGSHTYGNCQVSHPACNRKKGSS